MFLSGAHLCASLFLCAIRKELRSKFFEFPHLIKIPFTIAVSSLTVLLYSSRSSADDFSKKLLRLMPWCL